MLIESDLGGTLAHSVALELKKKADSDKVSSLDDVSLLLSRILKEKVLEYDVPKTFSEKTVFLILGVNGSGKTTSAAKLANFYKENGNKVLLCAADTFRAAAVEQLSLHAEKLNTRIIKSENAGNPAAVIFDAIQSFDKSDEKLLICDTAGRMHTRESLIKEIQKIDKIVYNRIKRENYKKFLVIDGTTGQNALNQAENFDKALGIDALIVTKLDSSSKGGSLVRVQDALNIPVAFVGNGEKYSDIHPFSKDEFIQNMLK